MQGLRTTLVLACLLVVGGAALLIVKQYPSSDEADGTTDELVSDVDREEVHRLALHPASGPSIVCERRPPDEGGGDWLSDPWRIVEPIDSAADATIVRQMISGLLGATVKEKIDEPDPEVTGLDPARLRVVLTVRPGDGTDGEEREVTVLLGEAAPLAGSVFARSGDRTVTVAERVREQLGKSPDQIRDRRPFPVGRTDVRRVRVSWNERSLELAKDGTNWEVRAPYEAPARTSQVDQLLSALFGLGVARFVDQPTGDEATGLEYGPRVVLEDVDGRTHALSLGREVGPDGQPGQVWGRRGGEDGSLVVLNGAASVLDRLRTNPETYRSRRLLRIGASEVTTLQIVRPGTEDGGRTLLEKDELTWRFAGDREAEADATSVGSLITDLREMEWTELARASSSDPSLQGLDPPEVTVRLTVGGSGTEHGLEIGKTTDRADHRYVRRTGEEAVYEARVPVLDRLLHAWPVLRNRSIASRPGHLARTLTVREREDGEVALEVRLEQGEDAAWTVASSTPADVAIDGEAVRRLVNRLSGLSAARIPPPVSPAEAGLEAPWLVARVAYGAPSEEEEAPSDLVLEVGRPIPDSDHVWARVEGVGVLFAIPRGLVEELGGGFLAEPSADETSPGEEEGS